MAILNGSVSISPAATLLPPTIQLYGDRTQSVGGGWPIRLAAQTDGTYAEVMQAVDTSLHAVAVVPSDTANLAVPAKRLWVGGVGNLTIMTGGGETTVFTAVPAGTLLPVQALRVFSTGTTASLIVAMW